METLIENIKCLNIHRCSSYIFFIINPCLDHKISYDLDVVEEVLAYNID